MDEETNDYNNNNSDEGDDLPTVMRQEHALTVELRTTLNKREEEYKELLKEQKGLVANIWMYREKCND